MSAPHGSNRLRTVFVGNIPMEGTADDPELRALFAQVGPVVKLRIVVDHATQKRKGFAFVEYVDNATAVAAVEQLADVDFGGRTLRLGIAEQ
ncbi:hypothetical protein EMIHUDRAFT_64064, partial [Emiliania huxleyi CCMP1516]|uniref:RRM domain-containing protein n=2 Tax=Emiliania huxleyi TaxID=2903 RepID=A0A0D3J668_EMIH1